MKIFRYQMNDCRNRAATNDCPFQIRRTSPLRFTAWFRIFIYVVPMMTDGRSFAISFTMRRVGIP
jgi:hypothetical protein